MTNEEVRKMFAEDAPTPVEDPTIYAVLNKHDGKVCYDFYCDTIKEVIEQLKVAEYWGDSVEIFIIKKSEIAEFQKKWGI